MSGTSPGGRASLRDTPTLAASQVKGPHQITVIHAPTSFALVPESAQVSPDRQDLVTPAPST